MLTIGSLIRQRREELKIPQKEFAEKIGVRTTYLSDVENNRRSAPTNFNLLIKIGKILLISHRELLESCAYSQRLNGDDNA